MVYIDSMDPVLLSHRHAGRRVELLQELIGVEAGAEGRRRLTEHRCPECGDAFVDARPDEDPVTSGL